MFNFIFNELVSISLLNVMYFRTDKGLKLDSDFKLFLYWLKHVQGRKDLMRISEN